MSLPVRSAVALALFLGAFVLVVFSTQKPTLTTHLWHNNTPVVAQGR